MLFGSVDYTVDFHCSPLNKRLEMVNNLELYTVHFPPSDELSYKKKYESIQSKNINESDKKTGYVYLKECLLQLREKGAGLKDKSHF